MNKIVEYIILGAPDVGKTSLIIRYFDNKFIESSFNTIGIDRRQQYVETYDFNLNMYDTAGQERYFTLVTNFIKNKQCIFLCFSLNDMESFNKCKIYSNMIKNIKDHSTIVILVGTFLDMKHICKNKRF
jgi:small GTP-binding protein